MYNQYNLEANGSSLDFNHFLQTFRSFLTSEDISKGSVRSYVSDVRQFLNWLVSFLTSNRVVSPAMKQFSNETIVLLRLVNQKVLEAYKDNQVTNNVPLKTINRRFSALRRFGSFCQSQNWLSSNLFDTLRNVSFNPSFQEDKHHLEEFRIELWKNDASKATIKNYLNDAKQFIGWMDSGK